MNDGGSGTHFGSRCRMLGRFANSHTARPSGAAAAAARRPVYIPELKVIFAVALGIKGFTSHAP